jgi:hypothetical protein
VDTVVITVEDMTALTNSDQKAQPMEITTVQKAHSKLPGLKTPIPAAVVRSMGLQVADKLGWEFKVIDGEMVMTIRRIKE